MSQEEFLKDIFGDELNRLLNSLNETVKLDKAYKQICNYYVAENWHVVPYRNIPHTHATIYIYRSASEYCAPSIVYELEVRDGSFNVYKREPNKTSKWEENI